MSPRRLTCLLVLAAVALAACGGGGATASTPTAKATARPTPRSTPDEATKTGEAVIEDSAVAMVHVTDYRIEGSFRSPTYSGTFVEERSAGGVHLAMVIAQGTADALYVNGRHYLRMSASMLSAAKLPAAAVQGLANRWLHLTAQFSVLQSELQGHSLRECLEGAFDSGHLTNAGTEQVRGQTAIVVQSSGDVPGSAAARMDIAYHGLRPLHFVLLGQVDRSSPDCAGFFMPEVHTVTAATYDYVSFDPVTLAAPAGAIDVNL